MLAKKLPEIRTAHTELCPDFGSLALLTLKINVKKTCSLYRTQVFFHYNTASNIGGRLCQLRFQIIR